MDYGKTAYMRVEELEERTRKLFSPRRERNAYAATSPDREIKDGRVQELFYISGGGTVSVNVKITATVYSAGALRLYIGGKRAGVAEFAREGKSAEIIIASVKISEPMQMTLLPEDGFFGVINRAETTVSGADATLIVSDSMLCADSGATETAAIRGENGRLLLGLFDTDSGEKTFEREIIGCASACDIVSVDGGFAAVHCDGFGGVWGTKIADGEIKSKTYLFSGAEAVAAEKYSGGFVIAFVRGGEVFFVLTDLGFGGVTNAEKIDFPYAAQSVLLVKGAEKPTLIINSNGKSFLKICEDETTACGSVGIDFSFSASA